MRYIITKNGNPDFNNALELPCENFTLAKLEVERLEALQRDRLDRASRWKFSGKGSAFMAPSKEVFTYAVKEVGE
jgi:hypothetical protein